MKQGIVTSNHTVLVRAKYSVSQDYELVFYVVLIFQTIKIEDK